MEDARKVMVLCVKVEQRGSRANMRRRDNGMEMCGEFHCLNCTEGCGR